MCRYFHLLRGILMDAQSPRSKLLRKRIAAHWQPLAAFLEDMRSPKKQDELMARNYPQPPPKNMVKTNMVKTMVVKAAPEVGDPENIATRHMVHNASKMVNYNPT